MAALVGPSFLFTQKNLNNFYMNCYKGFVQTFMVPRGWSFGSFLTLLSGNTGYRIQQPMVRHWLWC